MKWGSEKVVKPVFGGLAFASLVFLLGIILILFQQGLPIFRIVNLLNLSVVRRGIRRRERPWNWHSAIIFRYLWISWEACFLHSSGSAVPFFCMRLPDFAAFDPEADYRDLAGIPSMSMAFSGW
jgi:hypothetical protein